MKLIPAALQRVLELVDENERFLIGAASRGELANYADDDPEMDDPVKKGAEWGPERAVRAEVIYALATGSPPPGSQLAWPVHAKGVLILDAKIIGQLDFSFARIKFPLALVRCHIGSPLILRSASAPQIDLTGSRLLGITANNLRVQSNLFLKDAFIKGEVALQLAEIGGLLNCDGGRFENAGAIAINAEGMTVGNVLLGQALDASSNPVGGPFTAKGEVRLVRANIRGVLSCAGGKFENGRAIAINAEGMTVGDVLLGKALDASCNPVGGPFTAKGEVRLVRANIGGVLGCTGGEFENAGAIAINAEGMTVGGLFLNHASIQGEACLIFAKIRGHFSCVAAKFENPAGHALNADGMTVGTVFLSQVFDRKGNPVGEPFTAKGEVRLVRAKIEEQLNCRGGKFECLASNALNGDGMTVGSDVFLDQGFTADGQVRLVGAKIGGSLYGGGKFENRAIYAVALAKAFRMLLGLRGHFDESAACALDANGMTVGGSLLLNQGFTAKGEVRLPRVKIDEDLNCRDGKFENAGGSALNADGMVVGGFVFLNQGFTAKGEVQLVGAKIGGQLNCRGGKFENVSKEGSKNALSIFGTTVGGALILDKLPARPVGRIDLGHAKTGDLVDDSTSWPEDDNNLLFNGLILDGFQYDAIDVDSPKDAEERIKWVGLQPEDSFSFQPYEQLAQVLRLMGDEAGAREVLIAKQAKLREIARLKADREKGNLSYWSRISNWLFRSANWIFEWTVGYGYRPWLALLWAAAIVVMGWAVFSLAQGSGVLKPVVAVDDPPAQTSPVVALPIAKTPFGPAGAKEFFHPLLFSLAVFLPAPDLSQKKVWVLKASREWDWAFCGYETWYIAEGVSGWALTILFTGALSGLIRRE